MLPSNNPLGIQKSATKQIKTLPTSALSADQNKEKSTATAPIQTSKLFQARPTESATAKPVKNAIQLTEQLTELFYAISSYLTGEEAKNLSQLNTKFHQNYLDTLATKTHDFFSPIKTQLEQYYQSFDYNNKLEFFADIGQQFFSEKYQNKKKLSEYNTKKQLDIETQLKKMIINAFEKLHSSPLKNALMTSHPSLGNYLEPKLFQFFLLLILKRADLVYVRFHYTLNDIKNIKSKLKKEDIGGYQVVWNEDIFQLYRVTKELKLSPIELKDYKSFTQSIMPFVNKIQRHLSKDYTPTQNFYLEAPEFFKIITLNGGHELPNSEAWPLTGGTEVGRPEPYLDYKLTFFLCNYKNLTDDSLEDFLLNAILNGDVSFVRIILDVFKYNNKFIPVLNVANRAALHLLTVVFSRVEEYIKFYKLSHISSAKFLKMLSKPQELNDFRQEFKRRYPKFSLDLSSLRASALLCQKYTFEKLIDQFGDAQALMYECLAYVFNLKYISPSNLKIVKIRPDLTVDDCSSADTTIRYFQSIASQNFENIADVNSVNEEVVDYEPNSLSIEFRVWTTGDGKSFLEEIANLRRGHFNKNKTFLSHCVIS